jgi:ABC-type dipeptide/oligopeptide/nickel transport system permease subunit
MAEALLAETTEKAPQLALRTAAKLWLPLGWLLAIVLGAAAAPWLGLAGPAEIDILALAQPPGVGHLLGTDTLGRDLLSRILYGARVSLVVGFCAPGLGMLIGLFAGMLAGYYRGRLEATILIAIDTLLALPGLVVLLLFSLIFGGSLTNVSIGLGILFIPVFTRISRANTLVFAGREFVLAARAMGARDASILVREILPNVILPVIAYALVAVATAIVVEGGLSFLGLSVPSPQPSWGGSIAEGAESLSDAPHVSLIPALVMFLTVLSFNLVGDALRARIADVRESAL